MIRILISGANGKMGRTVDMCAKDRDDVKIVCGIDINTTVYSDFPVYASFAEITEKPDVIIDFSHPSTLDGLLDYALSTGTPVVFATTGYSQEQIAQIGKAGEQIPAFYSSNMSLGVFLLSSLAKQTASILGNSFDIEIVEKHHNLKIDAPSGTALMLADKINEALDDRFNYEYDRHSKREKRSKNEIGIHSVRGGTIVGEHEIIFAGRDEVITLKHQAMSKQVLATGALNAAALLMKCGAGLYDMNDLIG